MKRTNTSSSSPTDKFTQFGDLPQDIQNAILRSNRQTLQRSPTLSKQFLSQLRPVICELPISSKEFRAYLIEERASRFILGGLTNFSLFDLVTPGDNTHTPKWSMKDFVLSLHKKQVGSSETSKLQFTYSLTLEIKYHNGAVATIGSIPNLHPMVSQNLQRIHSVYEPDDILKYFEHLLKSGTSKPVDIINEYRILMRRRSCKFDSSLITTMKTSILNYYQSQSNLSALDSRHLLTPHFLKNWLSTALYFNLQPDPLTKLGKITYEIKDVKFVDKNGINRRLIVPVKSELNRPDISDLIQSGQTLLPKIIRIFENLELFV